MWPVQSLNWDTSRGKLRGLTQSHEQLIDSLIYQVRWGQSVKSLTVITNYVYFTAANNYGQKRNFFICHFPVFLFFQFFPRLTHMPVLNEAISRTQLGFLWNTCPLIKQVLTVSSDHTFNCCKNRASANSHNNTANRSVPPTVALQFLPGPPVCISLKF